LLCDILFDAGTVAGTSPILPKPLPKPLRIICCVSALLAFSVIIAIMAIVAVKCVQDMPAVSILLGALDIIMIFLLLSIFKRAFGTGKDKK
jgi:uncharacterized PurR-regulated membrane protein YhhQ (DUF165 family)